MSREDKLSSVPATAKQDGDNDPHGGVEPAVWTARMLAALERGVKGGVWFSLMDKVYAPRNLQAAFKRVARNKGGAGVDHESVDMYASNLEANLQRLHEQLRDDSYRPQAIRRHNIPKPGSKQMRPLGIPTVRDRVAQTALRNVLEPIFERDFAEHSYGFRPKRGCKDALRRVHGLLRDGHRWVVDADLASYFDTIPHDKLMALVERKIADGRVLKLIRAYLEQEVVGDMEQWSPETGTPQGAVISPLLANLYLDPLDHLMVERKFEMVRYADDLVILCKNEHEAQQAHQTLQQWVEQAGLRLHPEKTRVANLNEPREGFDFLGYRFQRTDRGHISKWPRKKSERNLRNKVRAMTRRRTNGQSMECIISQLNPLVRGFFEYFKHSASSSLQALDQWIRGRLRSILRNRNHRRGRARGRDHQRWPNAYFGELGLFCMTEARAQALPIPPGVTADRRAVCGRTARTVRRGVRPG